jgi:hypothetical protein
MIEPETVKQSAELLRRIIRSIDKKLEYHLLDPTQEGRFLLGVTIRGRSGTVSLSSSDLLVALGNDAGKNAIRQKIKSARDHLLSNYVVDVMGRRETRMLNQSAGNKDESKSSFFHRRPQRRR